MGLKEAQHVFAVHAAALILEAATRGYLVALGEAHRPPELAALYAKRGVGTLTSLHIDRLALDLILRSKQGVYLTRTEDYAALGAWWKARDERLRWGGDFVRPDGNHFSLSLGGRA